MRIVSRLVCRSVHTLTGRLSGFTTARPWWLACALALSITGCSTFRGAPAPPIARAVVDSATFVDPEQELVALAGTQNRDVRNASMRRLMALIDVRYMHFRNDIVTNRRHTKSGANALLLATDVAATLTDSLGVKDNYIALSALIRGGETIYDKDYLLDRTIDALVAQMDANRKTRLAEVSRRMLDPIDSYPAQAAVVDVFDYYYAGTLNGALSGVQKSAAEQEQEGQRALESIPTLEQIQTLRNDTRTLAGFVRGLQSEEDLIKLRDFLAERGIDMQAFAAANSLGTRQNALLHGFTTLRDTQSKYQDFAVLSAELKTIGFSP